MIKNSDLLRLGEFHDDFYEPQQVSEEICGWEIGPAIIATVQAQSEKSKTCEVKNAKKNPSISARCSEIIKTGPAKKKLEKTPIRAVYTDCKKSLKKNQENKCITSVLPPLKPNYYAINNFPSKKTLLEDFLHKYKISISQTENKCRLKSASPIKLIKRTNYYV